jgi:hypothetical protein
MTPSGFSAASVPTKDSSSIFACTMPMRAISSSDIVSDRRPCGQGRGDGRRGRRSEKEVPPRLRWRSPHAPLYILTGLRTASTMVMRALRRSSPAQIHAPKKPQPPVTTLRV